MVCDFCSSQHMSLLQLVFTLVHQGELFLPLLEFPRDHSHLDHHRHMQAPFLEGSTLMLDLGLFHPTQDITLDLPIPTLQDHILVATHMW